MIKPSRRNVMKELLIGINDHSGKLLSVNNSKGKYSIFERDRKEDQSYFLTEIKGDYIKTTRIRYLKDGKAINIFMNVFIPAVLKSKPEKPIEVRDIILKLPISQYKEFMKNFRNVAPSLDWSEPYER